MDSGQDLDPLIGTRIGSYRIEQRLAAGGMGVVYRARNVSRDEDVAIKILAPSLASDQEYVTRFFREAGAAGQIDHPNVIRVLNVSRHEDKYYLVMQYVPGETLDRLIEQERRMSLERATRFVRGIAAGLAAVHRAGIIHRDVKPGNVLVTRDGVPHLTDFGLARHAESRRGFTVEGTFLGTPEYASPEQVEGRRIDYRTDLYSLGVTYFQLLSGTFPFLGESPMEMAIRRTKEDPRPLEHALPGAGPSACAIIRKLLQREPSQRYQSATELIRDLDALLAGRTPQAAGAGKPLAGPKGPFLSVEGKRRLRLIATWGLLILGVGLSFFSGVLAPQRAGAADAAGLRLLFLAAAVLAGGGAFFVYRRELLYSGRLWMALLLVPMMFLLALGAGFALERPEAEGPARALAASLKALPGHLSRPVNTLGLAVLFLSAAIWQSFRREKGVWRWRILGAGTILSLFLFYLFGAQRLGPAAPFRNFLLHAEIAFPLFTGGVLGSFFGTWLLAEYEHGTLLRLLGIVLCIVGAGGLYSFAVLASPVQRPDPLRALAGPFVEAGRTCLGSGTLLLGTAALGMVLQGLVSAGMRRYDQFYRRK